MIEIGEEKSPPLTIFVGPEKVNCVNRDRNNLCYQVKAKVDDDWSLYKGDIMGFLFKPGYIYELVVQADTRGKPYGDAPDVQWILVEQVNRLPVQPEVSPADWLDISWILEQFGNPTALKTAMGENLPSIIFRQDGMATGSSGCNRFNAKYTIVVDQIRFSDLSATKNMCPSQEGMLDQEQTIFYVYQQAGRFVLKEDHLYIYSMGDELVLVFKQ